MALPRLSLAANGEVEVDQSIIGKGNSARIRSYGITTIELTAVQMRTGNGTPVELVAAPGAGFTLLVERVVMSKAAGTAFGGVAGGEDIIIVYSGGAVLLVNNMETTGFLDQTTDEMRILRNVDPALGIDLTGNANTAIDYELLSGDITNGSPVVFEITWEKIDLTALVA